MKRSLRKQWLVNVLFVLVVFTVCITSAFKNDYQGESAEQKKPNIIFIMADDLGHGDLGCYGQKIIKTPHIDQLAAEGIRYTSVYSGSTVCSPSRGSLLTGKHNGHARIRGNDCPGYDVGRIGNCLPLRAEDITFAQVLQQNGYTTGAFGKWGVGAENTSGSPEKKGFDEYLGDLNQVDAHFYHTNYMWQVKNKNLSRVKVDSLRYKTDILQERALNFIRENNDKPFFLYLPINTPHSQLLAPQRTLQKFQDASGKSVFSETPYVSDLFNGNPRYNQAEPRAHFAGMVTVLDEYVGQVVDLVRELKLDDNTIIFFCSDNGTERLGGQDYQFFNSNAGLRGLKRDLYEGGIRIPMIAWAPGKIKQGATSDQRWILYDIFPTLLSVAGIENKYTVDGISQWPQISGNVSAQKQHEYFYWEFSERFPVQAVRKGDWKLLRFYKKDKSFDRIELYNLAKDEKETTDLSAQHPEKVKELTAILSKAHVTSEMPGYQLFE